jgi:putative N-acetylmannosamine-6-phosphate epimerase
MKALERLRGGLVVSCQPVEGGPLDDDEVVARLAEAAILGGARAIRIEAGIHHAARLACVRRRVEAPLIGIVKRDLADSPVRITPFVQDVLALANAGADIIAVDVTERPRPTTVGELLAAIHAAGRVAMADASNLADAAAAAELGFDLIGTTLSGYTGGTVPERPDLALVQQLASRGYAVMAEGRFQSPADAAAAIAAGAWAVTVGSALTRLEVMTSRFVDAVQEAAHRQSQSQSVAHA